MIFFGSFGLYIPSGFDSEELIDTVRSDKSSFDNETDFEKVFSNPNQESKVIPGNIRIANYDSTGTYRGGKSEGTEK